MLFLWWCGTYVCPFPSGAWPCLVANTTEIVKLNALVYVFKEVVRSVMYVYRSLPLDNCLELSFFSPSSNHILSYRYFKRRIHKSSLVVAWAISHEFALMGTALPVMPLGRVMLLVSLLLDVD